jgi:hypothetical protein
LTVADSPSRATHEHGCIHPEKGREEAEFVLSFPR